MVKKVTLVLASIGITMVGVAAPASADLDDYWNNPGRQRATEAGAQCGSGAGSGAFGAFGGKDDNYAGGANGYQTGLNNSAVCGNR